MYPFLRKKLFRGRAFLFPYLYPPLVFLQALLSVTSVLMAGVLLLVLAAVLFHVSDQFTDLLIAMRLDWTALLNGDNVLTNRESGPQWGRVVFRDGCFVVALLTWSISLALTSRWCLLVGGVRPVRVKPPYWRLARQVHRFQIALMVRLPRLLGMIPYGIVLVSMTEVVLGTESRRATDWFWPLVFLALTGFDLFILQRLYASLVRSHGPENRAYYRTAIRQFGPQDPDAYPLFRQWVRWLIGVNAGLLVLFGLFDYRILTFGFRFNWASLPGFGSLFVFALGGYTLLLLWIHHHLRRWRISLLGALACVAVLTYSLGLNVKRRRIRISESPLPARYQDRAYVDNWLLDSTKAIGNKVPVFIVAAEGGGSRSAYWTAAVLAQLDSLPGFREHLLAISGVSGGNVGGSFYAAALHDSLEKATLTPQLTQMAGGDFLSGLVGAFCYPDALTGVFLPFFSEFDRARRLEDSFSDEYHRATGRSTLDSGFVSLYRPNKEPAGPLLLLNATLVETGKKAIFSPVKLDSTFFYDARDVFEDVRKDIPLKTVMGLCSRFPVVTPAGTVPIGKRDSTYRLVDGGYYENTGLHTAFQLLQLVLARREVCREKLAGRVVLPVVLYIQNGDYRSSVSGRASTGFAPLSAFLNAWGNRAPSTMQDVRAYLATGQAKGSLQVFGLERRDREVIPLGWYLSRAAQEIMGRQAKALRQPGPSGSQQAYEFVRQILQPEK